jgi:hypothetical protein
MVTVDAIGQHAGKLLLGTNSGDNATLDITTGWLEVEDEAAGPGNGEIVIGAHASATAALNLSGGELFVKTLSKGDGGAFNFTGGTLHAETVNFSLFNNGGTIAPGTSPGLTTINGDFLINSGTLAIEVASSVSHDAAWVNGDVLLGGDLSVSLLDGYAPNGGDEFTIVVGNSIGGTFDNLEPNGRIVVEGGLGSFQVTIGPTGVVLSNYFQVELAGDYNGDNVVDAADYTVWGNSLGDAFLINETASLGIVDQADYDAWKANFGAILGGSGAGAPVPEPGTIMLLVVASMIFLSAYRRNA